MYELIGGGRVDFTARAPLHLFRGWAESGLSGILQLDNRLVPSALEARLDNDFLRTPDAARTRAMRDYFALVRHPSSSFIMSDLGECAQIDERSYRAVLWGALDFAGVRRRLPVTCLARVGDGEVVMNLRCTWSFRAFGFKRPRLLFLAVADLVDIRAELRFQLQMEKKDNECVP